MVTFIWVNDYADIIAAFAKMNPQLFQVWKDANLSIYEMIVLILQKANPGTTFRDIGCRLGRSRDAVKKAHSRASAKLHIQKVNGKVTL